MPILLKNILLIQFLIILCSGCKESPNESKPVISDEIYLGEKTPLGQPVIFKPGSVCKEWIEFGMAVSPDLEEFYFTRLNSSFKGSIYYSEKNNDSWSDPQVVSFSGTYDDTDPFITADGNRLYFTSKRPLPGSTQGNKPHIWFVSRAGDGWSEPLPVEFEMQSTTGENYPTLTSAGTLYFIADYSSLGGEGLYRSEFSDGKFQTPQFCDILKNNGGIVEVEPFIARDESYVLFYSAGRADNSTPSGQLGDIYISFRQDNNSWSPPKNIGSPVNTADEESHPTVSPDGKYFFFGRNVGKNNGFVDIFWVDAGFLRLLE